MRVFAGNFHNFICVVRYSTLFYPLEPKSSFPCPPDSSLFFYLRLVFPVWTVDVDFLAFGIFALSLSSFFLFASLPILRVRDYDCLNWVSFRMNFKVERDVARNEGEWANDPLLIAVSLTVLKRVY